VSGSVTLSAMSELQLAIANANNTPGMIVSSRAKTGGLLVCGHCNVLWML
jgi:hypothetical protein